MPAIKSAICLKERYPDHPKTLAALAKLNAKWQAMSAEDKLSGCGKDARILAVVESEIVALDGASCVAKLKDNSDRRLPLEDCLELMKLSLAKPEANWGEKATAAL